MPNVWDDIGVGEAGGFQLAVMRLRDEPSRWAVLVNTPLLHLWLEMPDHTVAHQALDFFERTHGKKWPVRVDMTVGTFAGRWVRLTKNDEDEAYFLDLLGPDDGSGVSDGHFFLRLEEDAVTNAVSALRQVVTALDAPSRQP